MRIQITPDDFKRAKLVKPGWFPVLIKEVVDELNNKKDAMNSVLDIEIADKESEFFGVPIKHWLSEKAATMPGGLVAYFKAFNPGASEATAADFETIDTKGLYIYAKVKTDRGQDGSAPPRNAVEDWAPLPQKYAQLAQVLTGPAAGVSGF